MPAVQRDAQPVPGSQELSKGILYGIDEVPEWHDHYRIEEVQNKVRNQNLHSCCQRTRAPNSSGHSSCFCDARFLPSRQGRTIPLPGAIATTKHTRLHFDRETRLPQLEKGATARLNLDCAPNFYGGIAVFGRAALFGDNNDQIRRFIRRSVRRSVRHSVRRSVRRSLGCHSGTQLSPEKQ